MYHIYMYVVFYAKKILKILKYYIIIYILRVPYFNLCFYLQLYNFLHLLVLVPVSLAVARCTPLLPPPLSHGVTLYLYSYSY